MMLFTGFEPFAGADENPSRLAARAAAEFARREGHAAVFAELPCSFGPAQEALIAAVDAAASQAGETGGVEPLVVVCAGLAANRDRVSLERVAINLIDARIPDNSGQQPVDVPVVEGGTLALPTGLPVKRALRAVEAAGIPVELSLSAGSYVCNTVFYASLALLPAGTRAGFVHLPWDEHVSLEQQAQALYLVARSALGDGEDLRFAAGRED